MDPARLWRGIRRRSSLRGRSRARVLRLVARVLRRVRPGLATEERLLRLSWSSRDADGLDEYLVVGWQNPRINVQSVLIRHALLRRLFGSAFEDLMRAEIQFAIELNEALRLESARANVSLAPFLDPDRLARIREVSRVIADREKEFEQRWRETLASRTASTISVLELACGSANDYRTFVDYGLAPFLRYTGVDLNPKNVANARRRFPDVDFQVGNAMNLEYGDGSFDVVLAADLFEHLPLEGAAKVLAEASRVARHAAILMFFNMAEVAEHQDRPVAAYHWNLLSRERYEAALAATFGTVSVTPIAAWLKADFGYAHSYNPRAYAMIATRKQAVRPRSSRDDVAGA